MRRGELGGDEAYRNERRRTFMTLGRPKKELATSQRIRLIMTERLQRSLAPTLCAGPLRPQ